MGKSISILILVILVGIFGISAGNYVSRKMAVRKLRHSIRSRFSRANEHHQMGNVYLAEGDFKKAEEEFEMALQIWPNCEITKQRLRMAKQQINTIVKVQSGVEYYEDIILRNPENDDYKRQYVRLLMFEGNTCRAREIIKSMREPEAIKAAEEIREPSEQEKEEIQKMAMEVINKRMEELGVRGQTRDVP